MTTPTPEEVAKMVKRLRAVEPDDCSNDIHCGQAADMLEALSRARDAEWNAAIEAVRMSIRSHSDTARKQLRACYEGDRLDEASKWSAIISHLDIEHDRLRTLMRPEGGSYE